MQYFFDIKFMVKGKCIGSAYGMHDDLELKQSPSIGDRVSINIYDPSNVAFEPIINNIIESDKKIYELIAECENIEHALENMVLMSQLYSLKLTLNMIEELDGDFFE